uniref:Uncharacterized protein n=1 Tax=Manihot esculenta TaxID=3983 RepID=A0A2C9UUV4_MANES
MDAKHHMLGNLASIMAKEICILGGLVRQKMNMRFLRKCMNTKPSHGPNLLSFL